MAVTQKQIAEHLGVSRQLVGLALQGKGTIAEETRQRVVEAAHALGYDLQSNREARVLIARRYQQRVPTGTLALLSPRLQEEDARRGGLRRMPFFHPYFEGAEDEAVRRETDLYLCLYREAALPRLLREQGVDGVVCLGPPDAISALLKINLPTVALGFFHPDVISLLPEDQEGTHRATHHLLSLGHTDIAYLTFAKGGSLDIVQARQSGYLEALQEFGLSRYRHVIVASEMTQELAAEATVSAYRKERAFTALVCYNDYMALGAMKGLREAGVSVPREVSITGFDDVIADHDPLLPLTSVRFDREAMGRRAVQILLEEGTRGAVSPYVERFPAEVVVRATTLPRQ